MNISFEILSLEAQVANTVKQGYRLALVGGRTIMIINNI